MFKLGCAALAAVLCGCTLALETPDTCVTTTETQYGPSVSSCLLQRGAGSPREPTSPITPRPEDHPSAAVTLIAKESRMEVSESRDRGQALELDSTLTSKGNRSPPPSPKGHGHGCNMDSECASGWCDWWKCRAEYDRDDGKGCASNRECRSRLCEGFKCMPENNRPNDAACVHDGQCSGGWCDWFKCKGQYDKSLGQGCVSNRECSSRLCEGFKCMSENNRPDGETCGQDGQCSSGWCNLFKCTAKKAVGSICVVPGECQSGECWAFTCGTCLRDGCALPKLYPDSSSYCAAGQCLAKKALFDECSNLFECESNICDLIQRQCLGHGYDTSGLALVPQVSASLFATAFVHTRDMQAMSFPQANDPSLFEYRHNDELKKFSTLMLAYATAVYRFENGTPEGHAEDKDGRQYTPSSPGAPQTPEAFCRASTCSTPIFTNVRERSVDIRKGAKDGQAAVYTFERPDDYIITVAFRGSETPENLDSMLTLDGSWEDRGRFVGQLDKNKEKMFRDWVQTDLDMQVVDDPFCAAGKTAGVQMHRGFVESWQIVKPKVVSALNNAIAEARKTGKSIKVFVTGHSLGAAMSAVATYDLWCNPRLVDGGRTPIFGTITFGQVMVFWGRSSVNFYKATVPKERRIRVLTCSRGSQAEGNSCDPVGSEFPLAVVPLNFRNSGYLQPDDDFQASWVRTTERYKSCSGLMEGVLCHLLDRYSQGLRDDDRYNGGFCAKVTGNFKVSLTSGNADQVGYPDAPSNCPATA